MFCSGFCALATCVGEPKLKPTQHVLYIHRVWYVHGVVCVRVYI